MKVIDCHLHINPFERLREEAFRFLFAGRQERFVEDVLELSKDPAKLLRLLDEEGVERAWLVNYVSPDLVGYTSEVNEYVANYCKGHLDRLVPVGSIHPKMCADPGREIDRIISDLEIRVVKLHPPHQLFYPNEYREAGLKSLETVYSRCQDHGVAVMIHTGSSAFPGARTKYGDALCLDDVAVDFPRLKIIMSHGGRPLWTSTAFFLLRRHANIFLDISGIPPKHLLQYFPRIEAVADKTMFGSDWPGPGVESIGRNVRELTETPLSAAAKEKILHVTAERFFK